MLLNRSKTAQIIGAVCLMAGLILVPGCISVVDRSQDKVIRVDDAGRPFAVVRREGTTHQQTVAVRSGSWCFVSGVRSPLGDMNRGFEREWQGTIDQAADDLAAADLGLEDAVSMTVYLTDLPGQHDHAMRLIESHFRKPRPATSIVGVSQLPFGATVQVDLVARAGTKNDRYDKHHDHDDDDRDD